MAKDETEVGITGQPVPKPRTAIQQYKLEKKRRERKHLGKNVGGTQYDSGVNPYFNPRSVKEEVLVDYLLEEGFASDEKSAQAIAGAMSEDWKNSIVEAVTGGSAPQMPASVVQFVDQLPTMIQGALKGKPSSSAKPSPKKPK